MERQTCFDAAYSARFPMVWTALIRAATVRFANAAALRPPGMAAMRSTHGPAGHWPADLRGLTGRVFVGAGGVGEFPVPWGCSWRVGGICAHAAPRIMPMTNTAMISRKTSRNATVAVGLGTCLL